MRTQQVQGRADVAAMLRELADEVDAGTIHIGKTRITVSDDMTASVGLSPPGLEARQALSFSFEVPAHRVRHVAVEDELLHPGG